MDWLISGLSGGAVLLTLAGIRPPTHGERAVAKLIGPSFAVTTVHRRPGTSFLMKLGRVRIARRLGRETEVRRRLQLAGKGTTFESFRGIQVAASCAGIIPFAVVGLTFPPALAVIPVACMAGVRLPEIALARRAGRRQERIAVAVPDLVEVLLTTTEAGLSPPVALRRTAEVLRGPLGEEVRTAIRELELGIPWHRAVQGLADRTDVPALRALRVALTRSQRLGSALGTTLRRVADDLRAERRLRAEEAARKAPIKMLFPLVFLILPAFLLLTVGPVVLATIRSLH